MMNRTISRLWNNNRVKTMLTITLISISSTFLMDNTAVSRANSIATNDSVIAGLKVQDDRMASVSDSVVDSLSIYQDSANMLRTNLIDEVKGYMKSVAPRTKMTADYIVDMCIEHGFDITLLLSQGHLETHFATCGSNSCFGVYNGKRYSHPNQSVDDYISLIQRRYIINRTTEQALSAQYFHMENNKNAKYCKSSDYCSKISKIRNNILNTTNIMDLYQDLLEVNTAITNYES